MLSGISNIQNNHHTSPTQVNDSKKLPGGRDIDPAQLFGDLESVQLEHYFVKKYPSQTRIDKNVTYKLNAMYRYDGEISKECHKLAECLTIKKDINIPKTLFKTPTQFSDLLPKAIAYYGDLYRNTHPLQITNEGKLFIGKSELVLLGVIIEQLHGKIAKIDFSDCALEWDDDLQLCKYVARIIQDGMKLNAEFKIWINDRVKLNDIGIIFRECGYYQESLQYITMSLEVDRNDIGNARSYANRAVTYREIKEYEQALADFKESLAINPKQPDVWTDIGVTYQQMNIHDQAILACETALKIYQNNGDTTNEDIPDLRKMIEISKAALHNKIEILI